ncbi:MAG: hypothetical protein ACI8YQ_003929, partial [Polaribacter sp.]
FANAPLGFQFAEESTLEIDSDISAFGFYPLLKLQLNFVGLYRWCPNLYTLFHYFKPIILILFTKVGINNNPGEIIDPTVG